MTTIAVTGASGNLGRATLQFLAKKKVLANSVVLVVRDASKVRELASQGFQVRHGDYTDAASLEKAFRGVDKSSSFRRARWAKSGCATIATSSARRALRPSGTFSIRASSSLRRQRSLRRLRGTFKPKRWFVNPAFRTPSSATTCTWT
jgi:uncharacterized protein YbjT (DUF2867 family)